MPLDLRLHIQPQHWFDDRNLIGRKVPEKLRPYFFPLEILRKEGFRFYWGSDSPLYTYSYERTLEAVRSLLNVETLPEEYYQAFLLPY